jgi:hypothetical protein
VDRRQAVKPKLNSKYLERYEVFCFALKHYHRVTFPNMNFSWEHGEEFPYTYSESHVRPGARAARHPGWEWHRYSADFRHFNRNRWEVPARNGIHFIGAGILRANTKLRFTPVGAGSPTSSLRLRFSMDSEQIQPALLDYLRFNFSCIKPLFISCRSNTLRFNHSAQRLGYSTYVADNCQRTNLEPSEFESGRELPATIGSPI